MSERFYVSSPLGLGPFQLDGAEAHHLASVLRAHLGDQVYLFNGDGREYRAVIASIAKRHVQLDILGVDSPQREAAHPVHIAAPLPKGDRAQFLLEKLTELGVTFFVPLKTARSIVHPGHGKIEKLERYVIEASKQCGRNVLLQICQPTSWEEYCRRPNLPPKRFLAHPGGTELPRGVDTDVVCTIGPEGGFTEQEVKLGEEHGWQTVGLGHTILRIETAALVIAAAALARH